MKKFNGPPVHVPVPGQGDDLMEQFLSGNVPPPEDLSAEVIARTGGEAPSVEQLEARIIEALKTVYDPEIPVNIYDLGLIYRIDIDETFKAEVDMTLTAPGCPVAQSFPGIVEAAVKNVPGVADAQVQLVWDPPWSPARLSEAARLELGLI